MSPQIANQERLELSHRPFSYHSEQNEQRTTVSSSDNRFNSSAIHYSNNTFKPTTPNTTIDVPHLTLQAAACVPGYYASICQNTSCQHDPYGGQNITSCFCSRSNVFTTLNIVRKANPDIICIFIDDYIFNTSFNIQCKSGRLQSSVIHVVSCHDYKIEITVTNRR